MPQEVFTKETLLATDDEIFDISLLDTALLTGEFSSQTAYIRDPYYYVYRGEFSKHKEKLPGVYKDGDKFIVVEPTTEEEKKTYTYADKVSDISSDKIIETINKKEVVFIDIPESSKAFLPPITKDDDILKRLIKTALIKKGIDIDSYRSRFIDKNALFNFKQVIKGTNRLSMLLFDRGCEALNLRYTIIIEEADPNNIIGETLSDPITASSDDTFDI